MSLVEHVSNSAGIKIASILNLNSDERDIVCYGAFCVLQTVISLFWVILFGLIFNVLMEAIAAVFTIALLRKYSGGVHATAPVRCITITTVVSTTLGLLIKHIFLNFDFSLIMILGVVCFAASFYLVYKLAPADTEAKPISEKSMIVRLKRNSLVVLSIVFLIDIVFLTLYFKLHNRLFLNVIMCTYTGIMWQSFTLTDIGYKSVSKIDITMRNLYRSDD